MRKRDLDKFRKLLTTQRELLIENARRALAGDIHLDPDDFPDEMDAASSEINLAFLGRLRERERGLITKIDQALAKIDANEYGLYEKSKCGSCSIGRGNAIARSSPASAQRATAGPPGYGSPSSFATLSKASPTASSRVSPSSAGAASASMRYSAVCPPETTSPRYGASSRASASSAEAR